MAIALGGVLNLLNRRYGQAAFGLRAACIGANVLMVCFAAVAGRVTGAGAEEQVVMLMRSSFRQCVPLASALRLPEREHS